MNLQNPNVGVDQISTVVDDSLVRVERIDSNEYVIAHSQDMGLIHGGLVSEDGMESYQVMVGGQATRFDPETLEFEYIEA